MNDLLSFAHYLKGRVDLKVILADYGKDVGPNDKANCPIHDEKTASFHVYPDGHYFCFACKATGDAISLIQEKDKVDFPTAVEKLAWFANESMPQFSELEKKKYEAIKKFQGVLTMAHKYFKENLDGASDYLSGRGFDLTFARQAGLGFAPDNWQGLLDYTPTEFNESQLLELKLANKSDGGRVYDFFRNRFMIPIRDMNGDLVGFGGRNLGPDEVREVKIAKYLNTAQSEIFIKKSILFGGNVAAIAVRETRELYVVEGYFDVLAMQQAGISNVVGLIGTALTDEHVNLLQRRFRDAKIILVYDGDDAGRKAAIAGGESLLGRKTTDICLLLQNQDPAQIIQESGYQIMRQNLSEAEPFFEYWLEEKSIEMDLQDPDKIVEFLEAIKKPLQGIPPENLRIYLNGVAKFLNIDLKTIERKVVNQQYAARHFSEGQDYWEKRFMQQLVAVDKRSSVAISLQRHIGDAFFQRPEARALYDIILGEEGTIFGETELFAEGTFKHMWDLACENKPEGSFLERHVFRDYFDMEERLKPKRWEDVHYSFMMLTLRNLSSAAKSSLSDGVSLDSILDQITIAQGKIMGQDD